MKKKRRIYCVEGVWNYGDQEVEPSVAPMLEMLKSQDLWAYARRDCATVPEFKYYIEWEWPRCREGSVLYIASHGSPGGIQLSEGHPLGLDTLGEHLAESCNGCLVHLGGCKVLHGDEHVVRHKVKNFLDRTQAMGISGYGVETGWTDNWAPALALELMLFSSIKTEDLHLENGRHFPALRRIAAKLQARFDDCEFDLYTRSDKRLRG